MRSLVAAGRLGWSRSAKETVVKCTPAVFATSLIVIARFFASLGGAAAGEGGEATMACETKVAPAAGTVADGVGRGAAIRMVGSVGLKETGTADNSDV
jgi:hypothetical protein